jgi:galactoside O-acetyltransferase
LIYPRAHIVSPEVVSIGNSVIVDDFVFLVGGVETRIGSFVHLASFSSYLGRGRLEIGDFVSISSGARLYTGIDDFLGGSLVGPGVPEPYRRPTRSFLSIGKHALVGANAVVFPGVTVGEGCAIGALSLVKEDCDPWTIYGGVPARPLKARPRERLLELERDLRRDLFDAAGGYIPGRRR